MKKKDYYLRYDHFQNLDLNKVSSFKTIKDWLGGLKNSIDVGCGAGHLTSFWGITGLDNDVNGITLARKRFPQTKFFLADAEKKLPFKTSSIDAIVCYNVLEHLTEKGRGIFFKEAKRVLKKEGIFIAGYIDESYWLNIVLSQVFKDYGIKDSTHLVSWKLSDFEKEISKHFKIVKKKKTSPYGKFTFITKFLMGEEIILAKQK